MDGGPSSDTPKSLDYPPTARPRRELGEDDFGCVPSPFFPFRPCQRGVLTRAAGCSQHVPYIFSVTPASFDFGTPFGTNELTHTPHNARKTPNTSRLKRNETKRHVRVEHSRTNS
uniref:Uncharacterized protein n=1 Tax=Proboscia inermis TaxID=420281 RepID=A0A7S0GBG4_9STRA